MSADTGDNLSEEGLIMRQGMMYKRAQGKSVLGVTNWKARFFVLTPTNLTYWDQQTAQQTTAAKKKGTIKISDIKAVEPVDAEAFQRPFLFQIIHDSVLYVQTLSQTDLEEWMSLLRECIANNDILHHKYHPGMFDGDRWTCCSEVHKDLVGCKPAFPYRRLAQQKPT